VAQVHADVAKAAIAATQEAASPPEPSWIYGMVIGFLGVALLVLVVAMVIASPSQQMRLAQSHSYWGADWARAHTIYQKAEAAHRVAPGAPGLRGSDTGDSGARTPFPAIIREDAP
jgi:hypothetical protein